MAPPAGPEHAQTDAREPSQIASELSAMAREGLRHADAVLVCLGGKAGRLGECIVGTALLEGTLLALRHMGKTGTPVTLLVDEGAADLFDLERYEARYWAPFRIVAAPVDHADSARDALIAAHTAGTLLVLGCSGAQDGAQPTITMRGDLLPTSASDASKPRRAIILEHLFRTGVRVYACRGPERRYADFIEDLFALPVASIDPYEAQPSVQLARDDLARFHILARDYGVREHALLVVCSFQSVVPAKCYEGWPEVVDLLASAIARERPGTQVDFLVACGPDELHREGVRRADLVADFAEVGKAEQGARVIVAQTPSLRDLAVLMGHAAFVLANDTGPGHLAGALGIPTVTPYLPGNVYSLAVWASSPWHHAVTLDPNPYTQRQLENAVLWDNNTIISQIPPETLAEIAMRVLPRG